MASDERLGVVVCVALGIMLYMRSLGSPWGDALCLAGAAFFFGLVVARFTKALDEEDDDA